MSKRFFVGGWAFVFALFFVAGVRAESPGFEQLKTASGLDLFRWGDTCNVYVLRDGDAGNAYRPWRWQRVGSFTRVGD